MLEIYLGNVRDLAGIVNRHAHHLFSALYVWKEKKNWKRPCL